jgi:hypothetical protein
MTEFLSIEKRGFMHLFNYKTSSRTCGGRIDSALSKPRRVNDVTSLVKLIKELGGRKTMLRNALSYSKFSCHA